MYLKDKKGGQRPVCSAPARHVQATYTLLRRRRHCRHGSMGPMFASTSNAKAVDQSRAGRGDARAVFALRAALLPFASIPPKNKIRRHHSTRGVCLDCCFALALSGALCEVVGWNPPPCVSIVVTALVAAAGAAALPSGGNLHLNTFYLHAHQ